MTIKSKDYFPFCPQFGVPHVGVGELQSGKFAAVIWIPEDSSPQALDGQHEAQAVADNLARQTGGVM